MVTLQVHKHLIQEMVLEKLQFINFNKNELLISAPCGMSIQQTLYQLDISLSQAVIAMVNGVTVDFNKVLVDGDYVRLLPVIAGGKNV